MSSRVIGNTTRSAPTSDPNADFTNAIKRLSDSVAELQAASIRGLPPRYSMELTAAGLTVTDSRLNRVATIALDWKDTP